MPPGRVTRVISRTPASPSRMKLTTSCESGGVEFAVRERQRLGGSVDDVDPGQARGARLSERLADGSAADTLAVPSRPTSTADSAPGPQPTSSARIPGSTRANAINAAASSGP